MNPKCLICQSSKTSLFLRRQNDNLWHCRTCDVIFVFPQLPLEVWPKFYGRSYFKEKGKVAGYPDYEAQRELYLSYFKKKMKELKVILPPKDKLKLLDVGCATGLFLELAEGEGIEAYGLDISNFALKNVPKNFRKRVYLGTLGTVSLPSKHFDIVTCFQSIEHFPDPLGSLEVIKRVLKPGGILMMTTPDIESFLVKILSKKWHGWEAESHLFNFNKQSFYNLLKEAEFSKINVSTDFPTIVSLKDIQEGIEKHYSPILARILKVLLKIVPSKIKERRFIPLRFTRGLSAIAFKHQKS